jgi:hypothetical protein
MSINTLHKGDDDDDNNNNNNNVVRSLLDDIKTKQLQWYGHVQTSFDSVAKLASEHAFPRPSISA